MHGIKKKNYPECFCAVYNLIDYVKTDKGNKDQTKSTTQVLGVVRSTQYTDLGT